MAPRGWNSARLDCVARLVVLTVYLKNDITTCKEVLHVLTRRRLGVERFVADFSRFDHAAVKGLDAIDSPVMRISLVISVELDNELERLSKLLNNLIDVYKVEYTYRI